MSQFIYILSPSFYLNSGHVHGRTQTDHILMKSTLCHWDISWFSKGKKIMVTLGGSMKQIWKYKVASILKKCLAMLYLSSSKGITITFLFSPQPLQSIKKFEILHYFKNRFVPSHSSILTMFIIFPYCHKYIRGLFDWF